MGQSHNHRSLAYGLLVASATLFAGWATGHNPGVEPAPMEDLLSGEAGAAAVTWDMPVTRNERVDQWIGFLSRGNADKTRLWLERSGRYTPYIRQELRARGMPEDLIYLAFIESGYSPKAYSRAAASGIWQFIEETGERYGLEVNNYVDERRDPIDATRAALDYLHELHGRFGSWYLAAAAYNSGENRIIRILRERAGGRTGDDALFWQIAPYLPRETRDYVPLMLAAGHIGKEPEKYGFDAVEYWEPMSFDTAWVPAQTTLALVAEAAGVKPEEVADLNPHLVRGTTPPGRGWPVRIPRGSETAFAAQFPSLFVASREKQKSEALAIASTIGTVSKVGTRKHTIKRGETLGAVAKRYGVSVSSLRSANRGLSPKRLQPGQSIRLPGGVKLAASVATTKAASTAKNSRVSATSKKNTVAATSSRRVHQVRRGENLTPIATRYDVSVTRLKSLNGLRTTRIQPGQRLRVSSWSSSPMARS